MNSRRRRDGGEEDNAHVALVGALAGFARFEYPVGGLDMNVGRNNDPRRNVFHTGPWPLAESPVTTLKVRSSAWRCIVDELDADQQVLMFTWGLGGDDAGPHWVVNSYYKTDIPLGILKSAFVTRIGKLKVVIPQTQRVHDLGRRELRAEDGSLYIV